MNPVSAGFSLSFGENDAEAEVVVAILRRIVVPIRRLAVVRVVVPTAASVYAVRAVRMRPRKKIFS